MAKRARSRSRGRRRRKRQRGGKWFKKLQKRLSTAKKLIGPISAKRLKKGLTKGAISLSKDPDFQRFALKHAKRASTKQAQKRLTPSQRKAITRLVPSSKDFIGNGLRLSGAGLRLTGAGKPRQYKRGHTAYTHQHGGSIAGLAALVSAIPLVVSEVKKVLK